MLLGIIVLFVCVGLIGAMQQSQSMSSLRESQKTLSECLKKAENFLATTCDQSRLDMEIACIEKRNELSVRVLHGLEEYAKQLQEQKEKLTQHETLPRHDYGRTWIKTGVRSMKKVSGVLAAATAFCLIGSYIVRGKKIINNLPLCARYEVSAEKILIFS